MPGHPSQPPLSYGGYGGELQHYRPSGYAPAQPPPTVAPPPSLPPPSLPSASLPPPALAAAPAPYARIPQPPQRPVGVTLAATLAVTASLQFVAGLTLFWLLAVTGSRQLGTSGSDGVVYHLLNRFDDRMIAGLAWPLYLFPLASIVLGLLLPTRSLGVRLVFSLLGAVAVAWMVWLFRTDPRWLLVPAAYVACCVGLLWTPVSSRWYAWRPPSDGHPQAG